MFSIIVPYWNAEKWIRRCADSLRQQGGDLEFIFVNDQSEDDSEYIVRHMADERFVIVNNQHAKGVSGARNTGLDLAKGEWITFLDADDEMLPGAEQKFRRMVEIDETANIIQANHIGIHGVCVHPNSAIMYDASRLPKGWCYVWNKLYRASFLKENEILFKEGVQYGEDELFNLECLNKDNRIFHYKAGVCTMRHYPVVEGSLSNVKTKWQLLQQSQEIEEFLKKTENPDLRQAICRMLSERWGNRLLKAFR